jgi:hypothetical protein
MPKRTVVVPLAALMLAGLAPGVRADPAQFLSFAVANHTSQTLDSLSIRHRSTRLWRSVTLDRGPIAPGASGNAKVDPADRQCEFDLRADFHGGVSTEQDGVNLCTLKGRTFDLQ